MIPLENIFYHNDVAIKLEKKDEDSNVSQLNLAIEGDPKYVNLSSHLTNKQKSEYADLLRDFSNIFAW